MNKPKRFYLHYGKLYITYRTRYQKWINQHIDNKPWHMMEEWAVIIGKGENWFDTEDWYYDGHTFKSITLFHIVFGLMYTYQSEEDK